MYYLNMDIHSASLKIEELYKSEKWFDKVGPGGFDSEPCILLYVKRDFLEVCDMFLEGWMGHKVVVRKSQNYR